MSLPSWSKRLLLAVAGVLLLALLVPCLIVGTASGSRVLLTTLSDQVSGLDLRIATPKPLWRGISLSRLRWQSGDTSVQGQEIELTLTWFCKPDYLLCIEQLSAQQLNLRLPEASDEPKPDNGDAVTLPTLTTPVGLWVKRIALSQFSIHSNAPSPWLQQINWHADGISWQDSDLKIAQSNAGNTLWQHQLTGHIDLSGNYPLAIQQKLYTKPPQLQQPVQADITLSESLQDLQLQLVTSKPGTLRVDARLNPLSKILKGSVHIGAEQLDPNSLLELPLTEISGSVQADFSIDLQAQKFHINANSDALVVVYRDIPYTLNTRIATDHNGTIAIEQLKLNSAHSYFSASGELPAIKPDQFNTLNSALTWFNQTALNFDFNAKQLSDFSPDLAGALSARAELIPQQAMTLNASATDLSVPGATIKHTQIKTRVPLNLDSTQPLTLSADIANIAAGDTQIDTLALTGSGQYRDHQLGLSINSKQIKANAIVQGQLNDDRRSWQGTLDKLRTVVDHGTGQSSLALQQATTLQWRFDPQQLQIAAACFTANAARLCTKQSLLSSDSTDLSFSLDNLTSESLTAWIPDTLAWQGSVAGSGSFKQQAGSAPRLSLQLSGPAGSFSSLIDGIPITQHYQGIRIDANAAEHVFNARFDLNRTTTEALIEGQATLTGSDFSSIDARVAINRFDIAVLTAAVPDIAILEGVVDVDLHLSGQTSAPEIGGTLRLQQGRVRLHSNPSDLRAIALNGQIKQSRLDLSGQFELGEGQGQLAGQFTLNHSPKGHIRLWGTELNISAPPMVELSSNLDITATFADNTLEIAGELAIPSGNITIAELPPNAQNLSSDVQIIDNTANSSDASSALALRLNLDTRLGPDLKFSGFGASARLDGTLALSQSARTPLQGSGAINIADGRYRGYGQKLNVRRGQLLFNGPIDSPSIDLQAVRTIEQTVVGLDVSGLASAPEITAFAEPTMPDSDALYALVSGKLPGGDNSTNKDALLAQALLSGGLALGGKSAISAGAEKLGISNFNIGSGDSSDLQLSGYLRPDVYLEYGVNALGDGSTFKVRWDFAKQFSLEMINSLQSSLDLLYSRSF